MSRMTVSAAFTLSIGACMLFAGVGFVACSSREAPDSAPTGGAIGASEWSTQVGKSADAIIGGQTTTSYPFAVGISIGGAATCSGTLIAPNLVLTARHCVSDLNTGERIQCGTSVFAAPKPAGTFQVTTQPSMRTGNPQYRRAIKVIVPANNAACGADIALLQLGQNIPASEAPSVAPLIGHTLYNRQLYSAFFTAIGYGLTGSSAAAPNTEGTRRIRQSMTIQCLPGRLGSECNIPAGILDANDVLTSEGTCQGDSGSAMYEQLQFDQGTYLATGVLSRGDGACNNSIYTRTDAWADFLVSNALLAATAGGYTAPAWTSPPAATKDDAPFVRPPKDAGADTAVPPVTTSELGAECIKASNCLSKLCKAPEADGQLVCTQTCGTEAACPEGYQCKNAFCFAGEPPVVAPAAETQQASSGCAVAPAVAAAPSKDPTKPIPWRALGLGAALALMVVRRRNRA